MTDPTEPTPATTAHNPADPGYAALVQRLHEAEPGSPEAAELIEELHARYVEVVGFGGQTPGGLPYPLPTDPVAQGADAIRSLAEALAPAMNGSARARASAGTGGYPPAAWFIVPLDALVDVTGYAGFTFADRRFTITRAGLYLLTGAMSMGSPNFALRIRNNTAPATTLTQTPYGGTVSFTRDVTTARYLPVGATITLDVYAGDPAPVSVADGGDTPVFLTIAALPMLGA
jgi:hypothetical protein